jgi:hypothetical protein
VPAPHPSAYRAALKAADKSAALASAGSAPASAAAAGGAAVPAPGAIVPRPRLDQRIVQANALGLRSADEVLAGWRPPRPDDPLYTYVNTWFNTILCALCLVFFLHVFFFYVAHTTPFSCPVLVLR